MFYVYLHKKKTNGEVFYVGKGTGNRIFKEADRSALWKRTAKKYGVIKEYYAVGLQEWYAFELERDLIAYYGTVLSKSGTLVNILDGRYYDSNITYFKSCLTDMDSYTFRNVVNEELFYGNRHDFISKFRLTKEQCDRLFYTKMSVVKDWIVLDRFKDEDLLHEIIKLYKKEISKQDDPTTYSFYNVLTEETVIATRRQFTDASYCSKNGIHSLFSPSLRINNRYKSLHGWIVLEFSDDTTIQLVKANGGGVGHPSEDKNIYEFINYKTKEIFNGTRLMFRDKYGITLNTLFCKEVNRKMSSRNWYIPALLTEIELDKIKYLNGNGISGKYSAVSDKTEYNYYHIISKEMFVGTRFDFKMKYGIDPKSLFRTDVALTVKGWCLINNLDKALELERYRKYK